MRIAYLVPEFPAQTHTFVWRERLSLSRMGIVTYIVSTRRPGKVAPHAWAAQAQSDTFYLTDFGPCDALQFAAQLMRPGLAMWYRAIKEAADESSPRQFFRNLALIILSARLVGFMQANNLTHVHCHSCAASALIAMFASRLANITYSLTLHGDLSDYGDQHGKKWRHAQFAITITRRLQRQVAEYLGQDVPRHVGLAPMGVDPDIFSRGEAYRPWDSQSLLRIFSCGRLNGVKGHQDLIRAVWILAKSGVPVYLEIAGEDEAGGTGFHKKLDALITELRLGNIVKLLGAIGEDDVIDRLRASHLFILASHHEPLGVAIMEAMSCETPVIATNLGGVPELIDHGVDGYLIAPKDPEALAEAIKTIADDPALAKRFASAGRQKVVDKFNSSVSAEELKRLLSQMRQ